MNPDQHFGGHVLPPSEASKIGGGHVLPIPPTDRLRALDHSLMRLMEIP